MRGKDEARSHLGFITTQWGEPLGKGREALEAIQVPRDLLSQTIPLPRRIKH
jgi:hypothetical protein